MVQNKHYHHLPCLNDCFFMRFGKKNYTSLSLWKTMHLYRKDKTLQLIFCSGHDTENFLRLVQNSETVGLKR
jgi:hypothetical protein